MNKLLKLFEMSVACSSRCTSRLSVRVCVWKMKGWRERIQRSLKCQVMGYLYPLNVGERDTLHACMVGASCYPELMMEWA